jgi:TRAP-type C4-dicarboxylate transport system substrate-binding protein
MRRKGSLSALIVSIFVVVFVITLSIMTVVSSGKVEAKVITWKFSTAEPPNGLLTECFRWWCEEVERRTGGRLKVKLYVSEQLCGSCAA